MENIYFNTLAEDNVYLFIMKSCTRYTVKIKGKSKILSIQRPNNLNF